MRVFSLILYLALVGYQSGYAQVFTFGPKVGANFSSLNFEKFDVRKGVADSTFHLVTKDAKLGLVAGIFLRFSSKNIYVQPEILYSQDRTSFDLSRKFNLDSTIIETQQIQFNKLDIPVLLGVKFAKVARVNAGIVATYIIGKDVENLSSAYKYVTKLSTSDLTWSWQAGMGLDLGKRMTIDLKYEGNIGTNENIVEVFGQNIALTQRKNTVQLTMGIALIKFKND
jgi:opacity protein-like surface antigen